MPCENAFAVPAIRSRIAMHDRIHLVRRAAALLGELSYFVGNDGEAAAVLAGTRRLDRRIQSEQIRLIGDAPGSRS